MINILVMELKMKNKIILLFKSWFSEIKNFRKPKVYRLRGYTTISRVNKKIQAEQNQRLLRNVLVAAIFAMILAILLIIFNPFRDLREILRMIGL